LTNPLQVIPTNETKELPNGERVYIYEVILGVRGWHALKTLDCPAAPCRIRKPDQVGQMLMDAMAEDNNHVRYSLLEHCEAARYLVDVLGYPQTLVAKRFTCSQPKISAMLKTVRKQDERILQMMADDSLNLEQVCILVDAFPEDLDTRVLCARYAIQQGLSNGQMQAVIQEINPPPEMGSARAMLLLANPEDEDGAVIRHYLANGNEAGNPDTSAPRPPTKFVLQRRSPMGSSSANIIRLARQAEFHIEVTPDGPVTLPDPEHTHVYELFSRWQAGALKYITFQMFEEAYLSDYQHAVQLVEESGITTLPPETEVVRQSIVDTTSQGNIRTLRAG
jgi:ParB-like chromosome segregation protein Spo0J